jgi:hypothetical protein
MAIHPEHLYEQLENLAKQLGISIRYEDLGDPETPATSGLCKVKGRYFYIMDKSKDLSERIRLLTQCLCRMDFEGVYVLPGIRRLLEEVGRPGIRHSRR